MVPRVFLVLGAPAALFLTGCGGKGSKSMVKNDNEIRDRNTGEQRSASPLNADEQSADSPFGELERRRSNPVEAKFK